MLRWSNPNPSKVPLCWLDRRQLPLLVILFWPNRKPIWWQQHRSRTRYLCLKLCALLCRNLAPRPAKFSCRHQNPPLRKRPMPRESKVEPLPLWRQHFKPTLRKWIPTVWQHRTKRKGNLRPSSESIFVFVFEVYNVQWDLCIKKKQKPKTP